MYSTDILGPTEGADVESVGDGVAAVGGLVESVGAAVAPVGDAVLSVGADVESVGDGVAAVGDAVFSVGCMLGSGVTVGDIEG